jgi:membrane associated rhomboid family serine protease
MIPLRDTIPSRTTPFITYGILCVNIIVFAMQVMAPDGGEAIVRQYGAIPTRTIDWITGDSVTLTAALLPLFTYMFLHGSFMHIAGNSLFLWVFGDNVEDHFGHISFLLFYILSGIGAMLLQTIIAIMEGGGAVPTIGASGAIAGVMGAYFVLFPRARVLTIVPVFIFIQIMEVPAILFLGLWILLQFFSAGGGGGVAWWAHIGGFFVGIALLLGFNGLRAIFNNNRRRPRGRQDNGKVRYIN